MSIVVTVGGGLLIAVALRDLFETVFHPGWPGSLSGDARFCQRDVAQQVVAAKGGDDLRVDKEIHPEVGRTIASGSQCRSGEVFAMGPAGGSGWTHGSCGQR